MKPEIRQAAIKNNLRLRAEIVAAIRLFFKQTEFLEVETPCRIPAPAPEAHIDAEPSGTWFLQTSPELCMKQMLAAGFPRIYQICKCFRNKERGHKHLPEMTLLEWYESGIDYRGMMHRCEELLYHVAGALGFDGIIPYQGHKVALARPWDRMTVAKAFEKYATVSLEGAIQQKRFDEVLVCEIEPRLGINKPVFLYDYPAVFGSFAKTKSSNPSIAERFELYVCGLELCNAFTELTDSREQRQRFEAENQVRQSMGKSQCPMPEKFLSVWSQMPAASGNALGIDRLTMLFADTACIDDVVAFVPEDL